MGKMKRKERDGREIPWVATLARLLLLLLGRQGHSAMALVFVVAGELGASGKRSWIEGSTMLDRWIDWVVRWESRRDRGGARSTEVEGEGIWMLLVARAG